MEKMITKTTLANQLNMARSMLYYERLQPQKDWQLKTEIEEVLRRFPSYGHKRIAQALNRNKKPVLRVMKIFGIKPYRRRRKPRDKAKTKEKKSVYPNLLIKKDSCPEKPNHIWATDFTYLPFKKKFVYLSTIIDLFSREIVGFSVLTKHNVDLVSNALLMAVSHKPRPNILHSDQGTEFASEYYGEMSNNLGIKRSMSRAGCPWENGYQEGFYSQFKVDLGDPDRFDSLGELAYNIYRAIYVYNNLRIHTELKTAPARFAEAWKRSVLLSSE